MFYAGGIEMLKEELVFYELIKAVGLDNNPDLKNGQVKNVFIKQDIMSINISIYFPEILDVFLLVELRKKLTSYYTLDQKYQQFQLEIVYDSQNISEERIKQYYDYIIAVFEENKPRYCVLKTITKAIKENAIKMFVATEEEAITIEPLLEEINKIFCLYGLPVKCLVETSPFETPVQVLIDEKSNNNDIELMKNQYNYEQTQSKNNNKEKSVKKPRVKNEINGPITKLDEIPSTEYDLIEYKQKHDKTNFVIEVNIESADVREIRSKSDDGKIFKIYKAVVTDDTGSLIITSFLNLSNKANVDFYEKEAIAGKKARVYGYADYDKYSKDVVLKILEMSINGDIEKKIAVDESVAKRVELHAHTKMSTQDGVMEVKEYVSLAKEYGFTALAVTDHANIQAAPDFEVECKKNNIKPIFGIEGNMVDEKTYKIALTEDSIDLRNISYVVYDIETTGLSSNYDEIIEIAACKVQNGMIIDQFSKYVKPKSSISSFITNLTSITNDDVRGSNPIEVELPEFIKFCEGSILVAHNATFDNSHIYANLRRLDLFTKEFPTIDTLQLLRVRYGHKLKRFNLAAMAKFFDVDLAQHHRAIYDATATAQAFIKMLNDLLDSGITNYNEINGIIDINTAHQYVYPSHVTILMKNEHGKKALYQVISDSHTTHFYREARIIKSYLASMRDDLLIGSSCVNGEVFDIAHNKSYEELLEAIKFYDYIEIQPLELYETLNEGSNLEKLRENIKETVLTIIKAAKSLNKIIVATGDVHHLLAEDKKLREIFISSPMVGGGRHPLVDCVEVPSFHFRSTDEMLKAFDFLDEKDAYEMVITNSNKIADMIEVFPLFPKELFAPKDDFLAERGVLSAADATIKMTFDKAHEIYGDVLHPYIKDRLDKEINSIISNRFATIYYISYMLVKYSVDAGYIVGSRGSVGSSLVAYMMGITEVNALPPHYYCPNCHFLAMKLSESEKEKYPLTKEQMTLDEVLQSKGTGFDLPLAACPICSNEMKQNGVDIPFETFLGFEGNKVPDIDLNFSGEFQGKAHEFCRTIFGAEKVFRAGTISTVAEKKAYGFVKNHYERKNILLRQTEIDRISKRIEGVKQSTGQHPGGIVVVPQEIEYYDITPIQFPADDSDATWRTTHYDYHKFESNLLKLDILGHDDPTMIRHLMDFVEKYPEEFPFSIVDDIPLTDQKVLKLFSGIESLNLNNYQTYGQEIGTTGIPEFGTKLAKDMLSDIRPTSIESLLKISGLSHGTDVWAGNAKDFLFGKKPGFPTVEFDKLIGCRDDIMVYLISQNVPAKDAFGIMEKVRKGGGINKEHQVIMEKYGIPPWYIESCKLIKYMFPKAHATAYVIMALRIGWFKIHRPIFYYGAYFSRRANAFDVDSMSKGFESIRLKLVEIDTKMTNKTATNKEIDLYNSLLLAIEMVSRGFTFKQMDIKESEATEFKVTDDRQSLLIPFGALDSLGEATAISIVDARNNNPFTSKKDIIKRTKINATQFEKMNGLGVFAGLSEDDQFDLFNN